MCPRTAICVLVLLYMCLHRREGDDAHLCVRILVFVSSYCYMCPHTTVCVIMLLYFLTGARGMTHTCGQANCFICVLMLLYMCAKKKKAQAGEHTRLCASILLYMCPVRMLVQMYYICVLILVMCPHRRKRDSAYVCVQA